MGVNRARYPRPESHSNGTSGSATIAFFLAILTNPTFMPPKASTDTEHLPIAFERNKNQAGSVWQL
jgi:hypothetical protein